MPLLRTCKSDMTSYGGFRWPESGPVACSDWNGHPVCGGGLHGLPWGEGDGSLLDWSPEARWIVWEAPDESLVVFDRKAKARGGEVVFCGDRLGATSYLAERAPGKAIVGLTATAGDAGTATAGVRGTATAGDAGTATAGVRGTATAGDAGTATAGDAGVLSLRWWDGKRYRVAIFYVGEDGIEPKTPYRCESGKAVRA